jgi:hypothetical protein
LLEALGSHGELMKYLLIWIVLLSQNAFGEQTVYLDLGYQDSSNYKIEQESISEMKMNFSGDLANAPAKLRSQLPMDLNMKQITVQSIKTGTKESNNSYPLSMLVESSKTYASINGSDYMEQPSSSNNLEGVTINGVVHQDGKMEYKSASGEGATDELKTMMKSIFEQMANSNIMAGKKVKVGETVPFKMPMSIPVGDLGAVNFEMEMLYTLESVTDEIANFNINFSAIVSSQLKEANISIEGTGSGVMKYDLTKKIAPSMTSKMQMDIKVPLEGDYLELTSVSDSNVRTSVAKSLTSLGTGQ